MSTSPITDYIDATPWTFQEKVKRRANSLGISERPVHWTWLHGPAGRPDPSPAEAHLRRLRLRSASAY